MGSVASANPAVAGGGTHLPSRWKSSQISATDNPGDEHELGQSLERVLADESWNARAGEPGSHVLDPLDQGRPLPAEPSCRRRIAGRMRVIARKALEVSAEDGNQSRRIIVAETQLILA